MSARQVPAHSSQGCCKVFPPLLSHQSSEGFIKVISEFPSGMSDIGYPLSSEQSKDGVVEHGQHLRGLSHAHLRMIFSQSSIAPIMQLVFDPPMPSGQVQ